MKAARKHRHAAIRRPTLAPHEAIVAGAIHVVAANRKVTPAQLQSALALVRQHVSHHGMWPDAEGNYLDTVETMASALFGERVETGTRDLDRCDEDLLAADPKRKPALLPSNAAGDRWIPCIDSALVLGMALGLGLAYYGDGGAR